MNDATALILYRAAVMAAVSGTFIFSDTVLDFFMAAGGVSWSDSRSAWWPVGR